MSIGNYPFLSATAAPPAVSLAAPVRTVLRYLLCGVLVLAALSTAAPAAAGPQADTIVRCDPSIKIGYIDQNLVLDLYIESVTNLNAVNLEITFDKAIAQVVDQDSGTGGIQMQPLSPPEGLLYPDYTLFNVADNTAGTVHYASTQMVKPAANGSGPVVRLTFQPLTQGDLNIVFTRHQLSTPQGAPVAHILGSCSIRIGSPAAVMLEDFQAVTDPAAGGILVTWQTAQELDNRGFNLWRGTIPSAAMVKLNDAEIPSEAPGSNLGAEYEFVDVQGLVSGTTYAYWLEDVAIDGTLTRHEPVTMTFADPNSVTLNDLRAGTAPGFVAMMSVLAVLALAGGIWWRSAATRGPR